MTASIVNVLTRFVCEIPTLCSVGLKVPLLNSHEMLSGRSPTGTIQMIVVNSREDNGASPKLNAWILGSTLGGTKQKSVDKMRNDTTTISATLHAVADYAATLVF